MNRKEHGCSLCEENWHSLDEQDIYDELQSGPQGLDDSEAERRLKFYGYNTLPTRKPRTIGDILLHQVLNPLIFILMAAAIASVAIGEATDALFILIVILLNSGLGAYQEFQAEKSAAGLQRLLKFKAHVRRNGKPRDIPSEEVVPGDIVLLESGVKVPADVRLTEANNLASDESLLTGESVASVKITRTLPETTELSERENMCFAGSTITSGKGSGIVVGTGRETQVGIIARTVTESESGKPPLVLRMEQFVKHISVLVLIISALLALLMLFRGHEPAGIFFLVVALTVSAIPEGLPVALTVALSIASKRMSDRNVIVRKLTAVESLGSCTVIASDKTGTLTVNEQTARKIVLPDGQTFEITGEGYNGIGTVSPAGQGGQLTPAAMDSLKRLAELAIYTNEGSLETEDERWNHHGDAMDVAFIALGYKLGLNPSDVRKQVRITDEILYESEKKYSAALYEKDGTGHIAVKGAAETVLDFCGRMYRDGKSSDFDRLEIERQALDLAEQGLRVLAVAGGETGAGGTVNWPAGEIPAGLVFHGLVGFIDPLRPEAAKSIKTAKAAGIQVIMITGDHPATAGAIADELNLSNRDEQVVSGRQLSEAGTPDSPAYEKLVSSTHVFARVSPIQKLEIVDILIRRGEFVAVTGDGVNDAPALQRANIGVAMGSGTDVAKEVGTMIVADDNFASIVAGIEEGRYAYDNVRKVIYLLISQGAAEVLMFTAAIIAGLSIPLLAVQLLWLNLVTNGIQDVALAFEGGEPGAMQRKPRRPDETIFDMQMARQTLLSGLTMGILGFGYWYHMMQMELVDEASVRNATLLLMVLLQNVHVFSCRSESESAFRIPIRRNFILIFGVLGAQGLHVLSMHIPLMQNTLGLEPVSITQWISLLFISLLVLAVMEAFKWVKRRQDNRRR